MPDHSTAIQKPDHVRRKSDYLRAAIIIGGLIWVVLTAGAIVNHAQTLPQIQLQQQSQAVSIGELRAEQRGQAVEIIALDKRITVIETKLDVLIKMGWGILTTGGFLLAERGIDWLRSIGHRKGAR